MTNIDWVFELKEKVPQFLEKLKGEKPPGFFKYSLSGDLCKENVKWGLGNTVFAVKIYYILGILQDLPEQERQNLVNFIKSFQQKHGYYCDPLVKKKAFLGEKKSALKSLDFNNLFHQQTMRAETRQAISSLNLLGQKVDSSSLDFPKTEREINDYLENLDWEKPWGAGSHFSHLVFFLKNSDLKNTNNLINSAISWVNKIQNSKDGSWHKGDPTLQHKVNGAMKVITAYKVAGKVEFKYPEKLIDLCLVAKNDLHACDNFNITYVLHYANKIAQNSYRHKEIKEFAQGRLRIYNNYYFPKIGGFSFLLNKANIFYYGARITRGFEEPDIHGTVMFLWGISIISQILDINNKLGFKELIP